MLIYKSVNSKHKSTSFPILDKLLWGMIFFWLIIDSITGFFISYGINMPLSQIFKLLILLLIIIRLCRIKIFLTSLSFLSIYIAWYFLHLALINKDYSLPLLLLSKFLTLLFLYAYFRHYLNKYPAKLLINAQKALVIAWIVIAFNVIIGVMGYGIPTYGESEEDIDMGVKGFFFAGNELGGIMAVLAPFMVYIVQTRLYSIKRILAILTILTVGVLVGTKSSILASLLSAIVVPLLYMPLRQCLKTLFIFSIFVIFLFSSPFIKNILSDISIGLIDRWIYFYNEEGGEITKFILSGRDVFWDSKKELFLNSNLITQMFGMGAEGKFVERDHLDFLLIFGYLGLIVIVSFYSYLLVIAIKFRHNNPLVKVIIFSDLLVISIGYIAGHVWYTAMSSVYIALLNALAFINNETISQSPKLK